MSINCPTKETVPDSPAPKLISGCSIANTSSLPAVYSFTVTAPDKALTNVCGYCWPRGDAPTLTVIEVGVVAVIASFFSYAGSELGELVTDNCLGYAWFVKFPSWVQVNVIPFSTISTLLAVVKLCEPIVISKSPVVSL